MITRHSEEVSATTVLPNTELKGKELVAEADNMHHTAYEVFIEAGETVNLKSSEVEKLNHMYYCISGTGSVKIPGGQSIKVDADQMMAFSSGISAKLLVESRIRVYVVYCKDVKPEEDRVVCRSLSEIIGTERSVDWGSGDSRRFLLKSDGFPVSLTNTLVRGGTSSRMVYLNHLESAYYFAGKVTYEWDEGAKAVESHVNGTTYIMDQHDKHEAVAAETSLCICVFSPTITGLERHVWSEGYSSYELPE